jgi:hypothetical protein
MFKILLEKLEGFYKYYNYIIDHKIDCSNLNGNHVFIGTFERYQSWRDKFYIVKYKKRIY